MTGAQLVMEPSLAQPLLSSHRCDRNVQHLRGLFDAEPSRPPLYAAMLARVVDQNLPHQLSGHAKKMRPALPIGQVLRNQPQVSLVYERGGLQSGGIALAPQVAVSKKMQFAIDDGREQVEGLFAAAAPFHEEAGHFFARGCLLSFSHGSF